MDGSLTKQVSVPVSLPDRIKIDGGEAEIKQIREGGSTRYVYEGKTHSVTIRLVDECQELVVLTAFEENGRAVEVVGTAAFDFGPEVFADILKEFEEIKEE